MSTRFSDLHHEHLSQAEQRFSGGGPLEGRISTVALKDFRDEIVVVKVNTEPFHQPRRDFRPQVTGKYRAESKIEVGCGCKIFLFHWKGWDT